MTPSPDPARVDRRAVLLGGAATLVVAACGGSDRGDAASDATTAPDDTTGVTSTAGPATSAAAPATAAASPPATLTAADFDGLATCRLLPEKTAGPFPLDEQFDRRDITEGYPGHPVRLGLRVVDEACAPVAGAAVEVWHTDATGDYSAFADGNGGSGTGPGAKDEGPGTTFLRGTQTTGPDGIVEFRTIYPGWYPGRTPHIHVRVHRGGAIVLTSQLFFDDTYTGEVYTTEPYLPFGQPDTTNATDGIAGDPAAEGTLLSTTTADTAGGPGTLALANLGIAGT